MVAHYAIEHGTMGPSYLQPNVSGLLFNMFYKYISFSRRSDALPDGNLYSSASETCNSIYIPFPRLESSAPANPDCKCNVNGAIAVYLHSAFL